jgi:hypothetical protein
MKRFAPGAPWLCAALLGLSTFPGCRCTEPEPATAPDAPAVASEPPAASKPSAAPVQAAPERFRFSAPERLVAIGDLHADWEGTVRAFRLAGAIDESGRWSGGALAVVQTGDQLDRGPDGRKILDFLAELGVEAERAGGALHTLNGNHETMNVAGDFRYVTPQGFTSFSDLAPGDDAFSELPAAWRGRAAAFAPGGPYATKLSERRAIVMLGDTVFVHGGVLPEHVDRGVDAINDEIARWMRGERGAPPASVTSESSPVWNRAYGAPEVSADACAVLRTTLSRLGARRMVVGHTVQRAGVTSACDDKVFRIDVGIAKYYGQRVEVLELRGDAARILREAVAAVPAASSAHP